MPGSDNATAKQLEKRGPTPTTHTGRQTCAYLGNRNQQLSLKVVLSNTNLQRPRRDFGNKRDLHGVSSPPFCGSFFFEACSTPLLFSRVLPSVRFPSVNFPSVHFTSFISLQFDSLLHFVTSLWFNSHQFTSVQFIPLVGNKKETVISSRAVIDRRTAGSSAQIKGWQHGGNLTI